MSSKKPDFELFSSLRFDPQLKQCTANTALMGKPSPFYMLPYHRDRILEAAQHFAWQKVVSLLCGLSGLQTLLRAIEAQIDLDSDTPLRVRVALDIEGSISIQSGPTPTKLIENLYPSLLRKPDSCVDRDVGDGGCIPSRSDAWCVMPDTERTEPSPFSTYKTSRRSIYDSARERIGITSMAEPKEVLLVSTRDGEIMEGSLTSIILWRGERWVTPPVSSGGQAGTTRRWLIREGLVKEEVVKVETLRDGEECWLSNGVRGLIFGRISLVEGL